jgi:hypothetical protein
LLDANLVMGKVKFYKSRTFTERTIIREQNLKIPKLHNNLGIISVLRIRGKRPKTLVIR